MKKLHQSILLVFFILVTSFFYDVNLFKNLLGWTLGGIIVLLINIAFFGNLIEMIMKTKDVKELIQLFQEGKQHLKEILANQKAKNANSRLSS